MRVTVQLLAVRHRGVALTPRVLRVLELGRVDPLESLVQFHLEGRSASDPRIEELFGDVQQATVQRTRH